MAQQQHLGWQWQQHWGLRLPEMQLCFSLTGKVSGYRTSKRTNWPEDCDGAGMQKSAAEEGNAAADAGVKTWLKSASLYHVSRFVVVQRDSEIGVHLEHIGSAHDRHKRCYTLKSHLSRAVHLQ